MRERCHNAEQPLLLAPLILRRTRGVVHARDIKPRIVQRLDLWEAGKFSALCNDVIEEGLAGNMNTPKNETGDDRARRFNKKVLRGKLRAAVREATDRDRGGLLKPSDTCGKTHQPVSDVLRSKHLEVVPDLTDPKVGCFEEYDKGLPESIPACFSDDMAISIAQQL